MPAEASLSECCDVLDELQAVFQPREDVEKVTAIAALHAEIARMCEARDVQARDLIRGERRERGEGGDETEKEGFPPHF